jgi:hypothetical protein
MAFNMIETTALSVFENLIDFPTMRLEKSLSINFKDYRQEKLASSLAYSIGLKFQDQLLNGGLTPFIIINDIDPIKTNSSTMAIVEAERLNYLQNCKTIIEREDLHPQPALYQIQDKANYVTELYKHLACSMSSKEKDYLINKALEAHEKLHKAVTYFETPTRTTLPNWLSPPLE